MVSFQKSSLLDFIYKPPPFGRGVLVAASIPFLATFAVVLYVLSCEPAQVTDKPSPTTMETPPLPDVNLRGTN